MSKPRVVIESPYGSPHPDVVKDNEKYLLECIQDSLARGEAPFASHYMYTEALDDNRPEDRECGMEAGFAWNEVADYAVVYIDRGISTGMVKGIELHRRLDKKVLFRSLRVSVTAVEDT